PQLAAGNQWLGFQRGAASLWSRAGSMPRPRMRACKVAVGHLAASLLASCAVIDRASPGSPSWVPPEVNGGRPFGLVRRILRWKDPRPSGAEQRVEAESRSLVVFRRLP
ncbi:MAG: hypothetical protein KKH04_16515, partial [Proteobacteria bacterium]|nr:hypothetical protein [Pseudomonadota bacterium]